MKITILGDMMCEPPVLKAAKQKGGNYDFSPVFAKVKPMLDEADYVISNLEFPMAGEEAGYTDRYYVFNAPDSFAKAVKDAGVDMVSTVNNHSFDRGLSGMVRTIKVLDELGIPHTGTFLPDTEREEACYFETNGVTIGVVAYTYTTNSSLYGDEKKYRACVNYLRPYEMRTYLPEVGAKLTTWVDRRFPKLKEEHRAIIKMCVGIPNTIERADDFIDEEAVKPYIEQFVKDIQTAKEKADIVIAYPHVGGQFNIQPGRFSEYVADAAIKAGADAVMASHSHMVQPAMWKEGIPCAYSLGNFNMDPISTIVVKKNLPGLGLAFHLYLEDKKIETATFSIIKTEKKWGEQMVPCPVDVLFPTLKSQKAKKQLEQEVRQVYRWVTGGELGEDWLKKEYELKK